MEMLTAGQWFVALLCAAAGLTIASILWRLPQIERLEVPGERPLSPEAATRTG
jgi:hypothetical protein